MIIAVIAYNLKKLLKYSEPKVQESVKQVELLMRNCLKLFYSCYGSLLSLIEQGRMESNQSLYYRQSSL